MGLSMAEMIIEAKSGTYVVKYDDEDQHLIDKYNWFIQENNCGTYYCRGNLIGGKGLGKQYIHRLVMNAKRGKIIDHADTDPMNNMKYNLRTGTHAQNMRNRGPLKGSKYKGVEKFVSGYKATINKDGVRYRSEMFKTKREAAIKYNELALKMHGEFARLNTIEELNE